MKEGLCLPISETPVMRMELYIFYPIATVFHVPAFTPVTATYIVERLEVVGGRSPATGLFSCHLTKTPRSFALNAFTFDSKRLHVF